MEASDEELEKKKKKKERKEINSCLLPAQAERMQYCSLSFLQLLKQAQESLTDHPSLSFSFSLSHTQPHIFAL